MPSESSSKPPKERRKPRSISHQDAEAQALKRHNDSAYETYGRGPKIRPKSVKDKKLRSNLRSLEQKCKDASVQAKDAEVLLADNTAGLLVPENELERTYKVRQEEIREEVSIETAKKSFELRLEGGPYDSFDFGRNGRDLLLGGRKGHVASMDWRDGKLGCELQLAETIRDVKWLNNNQRFAVAQKNCVYLYGHDGVELHRLKKHSEPLILEYLPYHFLLASISISGKLSYTDISTGIMVGELPTKLGPPSSLCQNPYNGILHTGHRNGLITLWSPNSSSPLVKMMCHKGPVRSVAISKNGQYMISTGQDRKLSVYDIRTYKELHSHYLRQPGSTVAISDRNLVGVGWGTQVSVYRPDDLFNPKPDIKIPAPYMSWGGDGQTISRVRFCPFEDVLGISHDKGFSNIIVPGAGEPNPDTLEPGLNPYETTKQRQEAEVHALLEKLQPEMIALDPNFVGNLDTTSHEQKMMEKDLDRKEEDKIVQLKKKGRGRNSALRRHLRLKGQKNVITEEKLRAKEALRSMEKREIMKVQRLRKEYGPALARFATKNS